MLRNARRFTFFTREVRYIGAIFLTPVVLVEIYFFFQPNIDISTLIRVIEILFTTGLLLGSVMIAKVTDDCYSSRRKLDNIIEVMNDGKLQIIQLNNLDVRSGGTEPLFALTAVVRKTLIRTGINHGVECHSLNREQSEKGPTETLHSWFKDNQSCRYALVICLEDKWISYVVLDRGCVSVLSEGSSFRFPSWDCLRPNHRQLHENAKTMIQNIVGTFNMKLHAPSAGGVKFS